MLLLSTLVLLYVLQVLHKTENCVALPNDTRRKQPTDVSQFHKGDRPLMFTRDTAANVLNRRTVPPDREQPESERHDAAVNREINLSWDETKIDLMKPPDNERPRVIRSIRSKRFIRHCRIYNGSNTCISCVVGYFGELCQHKCHSSCLHGCLMEDGHCWSCMSGTFGHYCEKNCSATCGDGECNVTTGRCLEGCIGGFWGERCENSCGKCLDSSCLHEDGTCLKGCQTGFHGPKCDKSCPEKTCPENCMNNCSWSGVCEAGCKPGFRGLHCNESCLQSCSVCTQHNNTCLKWDVDSDKRHVNRSLLVSLISVSVVLVLIIAGFIICNCLGICKLSMSGLKGRSPSQTKGLTLHGCVFDSQESDVSLI